MNPKALPESWFHRRLQETAGRRTTGPGARPGGPDDAGAMAGKRPIIVHLPSPTGGRRVRVDGEILGLAHNVRDLVEFLRRAGLEIEPEEVADSPLIDWRGVGPDRWEAETRT
ncbi:hypothetical protein Srubr_58250 [Streptomyces rubradiris]|nr:hypothetical protein GCM10018792_30090 [Streptomyces rubradiris]GHI55979.1 hypothetical protein Srubr_58250 [Streptomyces rubradiris]